jgi:glutamate-1-semialdehyde 2,1-aminomutase
MSSSKTKDQTYDQMKNVHQQSQELFEKAQLSIPGGVNSPVRAFKSVGGSPIFMKSAKGAYLYDADGNRYIDFINSWGPMILGHGVDQVVEAIRNQARNALSFGAPTEMETELAELIKLMVPGIDLIRLVSSGTEACMSALRLARGFTGKNKFIKFEGCYHGHADPFLVKAGSGLATFDIKNVPGITPGVAGDTLTCPYNDIQKATELMTQHSDEIAAIIIEPVAGNMGCILPEKGFLEGLRKLCTENGSLLIFDEVMTGFRLAAGGAQERLNVYADLLVFGKVIGGGMPVGAFGGRKEIMEHIAPSGKIYQAGTLSGNPVAVAAGHTTLSLLNADRKIYDTLEKRGEFLEKGLSEVFISKGIPHSVNRMGSMISLHFGNHKVTDFATSSACNTNLFNQFFHHMLNQGVYLPPSAFETWFISHAITETDIEQTITAAKKFS